MSIHPRHCLILVLALSAPWSLAAQSPDHNRIIVTGERRALSFDETASSLVVITDRDLALHTEITRLDDILNRTPNVVLGSGGVGPTIRGQDTTGVLRDLPAFIGGNRPRTTVVVDGRPISYNEFVFGSQSLWDVERVELYLSPQSTTQGRNSIAGAIFVETSDPEFGWTQKAQVQVGERDARQTSMTITGPIVADQLAFRLAGDIRRARTFNELTSAAPGIDPNRDDFENFRAKLLVTPARLSGLEVLATYSRNHSQAPQIVGARKPFTERRDPAATYGIFQTKVDALTVRSDWEPGPGWDLQTTVSIGDGIIERIAPAGLGEARNDVEDRMVEAVLTRRAGPLVLLMGASTTWIDLLQTIDVSAVGLGKGRFTDRQTSLGLFANASYELGGGFMLDAGGRYQRDRQDRHGTLLSNTAQRPFDFDETFVGLSYKLALHYDPTPHLRIGASTRRGTNPGGATLSPLLGDLDRFEMERLQAYELFARWRSPDGALSLGANLFLYRLTDAQRGVLRAIQTPGGAFFLLETGNVPKAMSRGGEVHLRWAPSARLSASLALGLLDTEILEAPTAADPLNGKAFQRSPPFSGVIAASWTPHDSVTLSADLRHRSGYFSDDANTQALAVGPATSLDLRAAHEIGPHRFFVHATNVLDSFYLTSLFGPVGDLATLGDPRAVTAGIELRF